MKKDLTDATSSLSFTSLGAADFRPQSPHHLWTGVVLHHTGIGSYPFIDDDDLWRRLYKNIGRWLARKDDVYVSSHFIIGRQGEISRLVNPKLAVAFHAGRSSFWDAARRRWRTGCNDFMIGVELVGDGNKQTFSDEQYLATARLTNWLMGEFPSIEPNCIVGHEAVSPGRKVDPGRLFEWKKFYWLLAYYGGFGNEEN